MFEQMMKVLEQNLKHDIAYYLKHNVKSPNLSKIQREFKENDKNFKETCKRLKTLVQGA